MGVIRLPRLGETMEEARVVLWLRAPGERFARGDVLLEVETDKTVVEVPALADGVLARQLVLPGETVALGQPLAETEGDGSSDDGPSAPAERPAAAGSGLAERVALPSGRSSEGRAVRAEVLGERVAASPRARRIAREAGLDLAGIDGTGRHGRVSGADVAAVLRRGAAPALHVRRRWPTGAVTGAPLVLLHGLFDTARGWRDLPERLARTGHPVLVPDLPGHGRSPAGDGTLEGAEEAVLRILPEGEVGLVGHSLGAVLAARIAARIGDRLDRLVLIAPAGLGARLDRDFLDLMADAHTLAPLRRALARLGPGAGPWSVEALEAELERLGPQRDGMVALGRALARNGIQQVDIAPLLEGLAAPVTAVFGLEDAILDWRDCANLPAQAAIHVLRGVGHLPHAARPDFVADLILGRAAARR